MKVVRFEDVRRRMLPRFLLSLVIDPLIGPINLLSISDKNKLIGKGKQQQHDIQIMYLPAADLLS